MIASNESEKIRIDNRQKGLTVTGKVELQTKSSNDCKFTLVHKAYAFVS